MRLRPPLPSDATAVFRLLVERDTVELGAPDTTLDELHDQWRASEFDLAADARVVDVGGRIVAYAATINRGTMIVVAPDHQGLGLGTRLRRWAETRNHERGGQRDLQWIASSNLRAQTLLLEAGYRYERSYWRMVRSLETDEEATAPPPGVSFRPVHADRDASALHRLDDVSFQANADYHPSSLAEFREEHLEAHDFDPELSCVAEAGERAVGFLLTRRWDEAGVGFIALLGVHPEHRRLGLGTAMLRTAFAHFARAGLREAQLGVASDNPTAFRLYERVGMTERWRSDTYSRPVG